MAQDNSFDSSEVKKLLQTSPTARERLKVSLEDLQVRAKKSLGQNFLVNDVVIRRIIDQALEYKPASLIEIGPGPGALTYYLKEFPCPFRVVELDHIIAESWKDAGLQVFEKDALQLNWREFLREEPYNHQPFVLVSNLPYQISSTLVIELSLIKDGFDHMVLMFQKEVAQRIRAIASSEHYGLLSVIALNFWTIHLVSEAGPGDFSPPPKVASRVLGFTKKDSSIENRKLFLKIVKASFAQRRKLLKANLNGLLNEFRLSQESFLQWLKDNGLKETARAEELSPQMYVKLYEYFNHSR